MITTSTPTLAKGSALAATRPMQSRCAPIGVIDLRGDAPTPLSQVQAAYDVLARLSEPLAVVALRGQNHEAELGFVRGGQVILGDRPRDDAYNAQDSQADDLHDVLAWVPRLKPNQLGDPSFLTDHRVRFNYMVGSMANGIASVELVEAAARAGLLASYGAAGQPLEVIDEAITRLQQSLGSNGETPFAFNLIHSPNEPAHEAAVVDLYLKRGIHLVEASAYLDLTLPVVRYRLTGIHEDAQGRIITPNRIIAKASRIEVATRWLSPPPERFVRQLVESGELSEEQATLARRVPMADDVTAEADSGGHTDNRPALTLMPTFLALRDRLAAEYGYAPPRIGAAGGIATPQAAAAAFAIGAAYIVTGTVNQACIESGSSDRVRDMLAKTQQADVAMAPAADMFEMGVKLQVLKRGTMFAMRAQKLYELYRAHPSLEAIPTVEREALEKTIFRAPIDTIWQQTREYFGRFDPAQVEKAQHDAKHRMALVFRWYLGLSSRWANAGDAARQIDYQVWCGPAMGAFNEWVQGSCLEQPVDRGVAAVAMNILHGAAIVTRINALRQQGVPVAPDWMRLEPRPLDELVNLVCFSECFKEPTAR